MDRLRSKKKKKKTGGEGRLGRRRFMIGVGNPGEGVAALPGDQQYTPHTLQAVTSQTNIQHSITEEDRLSAYNSISL